MTLPPLPLPAESGPAACTCAPVHAATAAAPAGGREPDGTSVGRFGPTHALILLIAILSLGSGLFLAGTDLQTVFALLSGCGAIGAATLTATGGGRRLISVLAEAAVRSSAGK